MDKEPDFSSDSVEVNREGETHMQGRKSEFVLPRDLDFHWLWLGDSLIIRALDEG